MENNLNQPKMDDFDKIRAAHAPGTQLGRGETRQIRKVLSTERKLEVWNLKTKQGLTNAEIARILDINPTTVRAYLNQIMADARETLYEDIERWKMEQHHRYDFIYAESMAAWQESKKNKRRDTIKRLPLKGGRRKVDQPADDLPDEVKTMTEAQTGDPRYLAAASAALNAQAKLWGMNAPEQIETKSLIANVKVNSGIELEAIRDAEEAFRKRRYGDVSGGNVVVTGTVVPAVRQDQPPDEGADSF